MIAIIDTIDTQMYLHVRIRIDEEDILELCISEFKFVTHKK